MIIYFYIALIVALGVTWLIYQSILAKSGDRLDRAQDAKRRAADRRVAEAYAVTVPAKLEVFPLSFMPGAVVTEIDDYSLFAELSDTQSKTINDTPNADDTIID